MHGGTLFHFAPYGGFLPLDQGDEVVWSPSLSATRLTGAGSLHPLICEVARRVGAELAFCADEPAYMAARLLERQGYLSSESQGDPEAPTLSEKGHRWVVWDRFSLEAMLAWSPPSGGGDVTHLFCGAEAEQCWAYRLRPAVDVCFACVVRRWLANLRLGDGLRHLVRGVRLWRWQCARSAEEWFDWSDSLQLEAGQYCWAPMTERQVVGAAVTTPQCGCGPGRVAAVASPLSLIAEVRDWDGPATFPWACATATSGEREWLQDGAAEAVRGTGCDLDATVAHLQAQGEAIERYCAGFIPSQGLRLDKKARPSRLFSPQQLARQGFPFRASGAGAIVETQELGGTSKRWFPLEMVYLVEPQERWGNLAPSLSHGLAAGPDLESACQSALWELLERDALVYLWVSWVGGAAIQGRSWTDGELEALPPTPGLRRQIIEVAGIVGRACVAVLFDEEGRPACGSAASPEPLRAAHKALAEAWQNHQFLRARGGESLPIQGAPRTYSEHAHYYWHRPHLFPRPPVLTGDLPFSSPADLLEALKRQGVALYWRDLTSADAAQSGYRVVRVLAPQLLAPPQNHDHWTLGAARWRERFGAADRPSLPHPFA